MTSLLPQLIIIGALVAVGNAKPSRLPWKVDPRHQSDVRHNVPEFHEDNGAFFYPDQEFFKEDPFKVVREHKNHKHEFKEDEDFSGWAEMEDDEDAIRTNRIPTMSREPTHFVRDLDIDFGPDDVIHEVFPHGHKKHSPYIILEEEHFGNELNDIDKVQELTRRMEQMQREMQQMKTMIANEYTLLKRHK